MARGFESKDVEFQQAEADRGTIARPPLTAGERDRAAQKRTIELSLANATRELAAATRPVHRRMLEGAVSDLERQLVAIGTAADSSLDGKA